MVVPETIKHSTADKSEVARAILLPLTPSGEPVNGTFSVRPHLQPQ